MTIALGALMGLGCSGASGARTVGLQGADAVRVGSQQPVNFTITVDASAFSNKKQLTVAIYDAEQLGREQSGTATPEETFVFREELARGLVVPSRTVTVGERYRVVVSGMAADDCNRASASAEGVASGDAISLSDLTVVSTKMACPPLR
jgi:heat shock protein HslJ